MSAQRASKQTLAMTERAFLTALTVVVLAVFLLPLAYGVSTSLKTRDQIASIEAELLPKSPARFQKDGQSYDLFRVPSEGGRIRELALVTKGRARSTFIDPAHPDEAIEWEGKWRSLEPVERFDPQWGNFIEAWKSIDFPSLLKMTFLYATLSTLGAVFSSAMVAYGFARFKFPFKKLAFVLVMATIILPSAATMIPTYAFFFSIGWVGTWLPLIVPTFFSNAYNIFLIRQFLLGIPKELDEAAKIDGAGPFSIFLKIILPQAIPALIAVALFHFFFCWNDFMGPLLYLAGKSELNPISVGLSAFRNMYTQEAHLIQAAGLIACVLPFVVFFTAQRFFIQGVVVTGVEK
jgi:multiple sugar transport system permease protein